MVWALQVGVNAVRLSSYFVVDVGGALGWHLLHNVDWVPVVPANLLVVRAVGRVRSAQRDDDVTWLGAVVVPAPSATSALR